MRVLKCIAKENDHRHEQQRKTHMHSHAHAWLHFFSSPQKIHAEACGEGRKCRVCTGIRCGDQADKENSDEQRRA